MDLSSKFSKTYNRFEISTFEIRYMRNFIKIKIWVFELKFSKAFNRFEINTFDTEYMPTFVKIRKLILFGSSNVRFEIRTFKIGYKHNFVRIRKFIILGTKHTILGIWAQSLKIESQQKIPDFPSFKVLDHFGSFVNFGRLFRLVLACLG